MRDATSAFAATDATQRPAISVLLPAYNAEQHVDEAIASVLNQTFEDFELIVIDDGSTDGTGAILERWASRDARIRLSRRANRGLVATLNELIALARGELLARMDADDICEPRRFELQAAFLRTHTEVVALGSRVLFIDPDGLPITEFIDALSHDEIEKVLLCPRLGLIHPATMLRADAVKSIGGYRSDYVHVEDLDLFLRLAEVGRLSNLPDVLLRYRLHMASVSHLHTVEQSSAGRRAVEAGLRRRGINSLSNTGERALLATVESRFDLHMKWGWWAWAGGHWRTATKHAWRAIREAPSRTEPWRLLGCLARDSLFSRRTRNERDASAPTTTASD